MKKSLKQWRAEKGHSLTTLAKASEVSRGTIWFWETGRVKPRQVTRKAVADALGVNPEEIE